MLIKSDTTGRTYNDKDACRILNPTQAALYRKNGCTLLDIYVSMRDDKFVYVFLKKETYPLYVKWCDYTLKKDSEDSL